MGQDYISRFGTLYEDMQAFYKDVKDNLTPEQKEEMARLDKEFGEFSDCLFNGEYLEAKSLFSKILVSDGNNLVNALKK